MQTAANVRSEAPAIQHVDDGELEIKRKSRQFRITLSLAMEIQNLQTPCVHCGKTTEQLLAAVGISAENDSPLAIVEAANRVPEVLQPTMVCKIVKATITSLMGAAGNEIPDDSPIFQEIDMVIQTKFVGLVMCDGCAIIKRQETLAKLLSN